MKKVRFKITAFLVILCSVFSFGADLNGLWENDTNSTHYWQVSHFRFVEIENNNVIRFLDCDGSELEKYQFDIDEESNIIFSNGNTFGKLLNIKKDAFELEQRFEPEEKEGLTVSLTFTVVFSKVEETRIAPNIDEPIDFILTNEWHGEASRDSSEHADITLKPLSEFNVFELEITIYEWLKIIKKNTMKVSLQSYKGVFTLNFLEKKEARNWFSISIIEEEKITLLTLEIEDAIILRKK